LLFLVAAAIVAVPIFVAAAAPLPQRPAAVLGVEYIRTTQQPDGGFGGFGPGQTMDAIYAIRAAGLDPNEFVKDGKSPGDYLVSVAAEATDAGSAAKGALAAQALGMNPRNVGGVDFVGTASAAFDPATGSYADNAFTHSIVVVALTRLGVPAPTGAVLFLREQQVSDGGWGFDGFSDADTTAIALQALAGAGLSKTDPNIVAGLAWLKLHQATDGGWGHDPSESNTSSTAYAVQALIAVGEDAASYEVNGIDPIDYLLAQQQADGSFSGFDPAYATNQVVPALAGRGFGSAVETPITPPPPPRQIAPGPPSTGTGLAATGQSAGVAVTAILVVLALAAMGRRREA
jgi:hypothetical protein